MRIAMLLEAATGIAGISFYSFCVEPRMFRQRKKQIHLPGYDLPPLHILHLSDFHFYRGKTIRKRFLQTLADQSKPDLILITGDLIDDDTGIDLCLESLRPFRAKYGIYCVFGNHDYFFVRFRDIFHKAGSYIKRARLPNNTARLEQGLHKLGIPVLRNERLELNIEGHPLTLAGLDDPYLFKDDIEKTFAGYKKSGPCLVLSHTPDRYAELREKGADILFSGHTHGGQIRFPFFGPLVTRTTAPRHLVYGLTHLDGLYVYNTSGVGNSRFCYPRLLCPPEVTYFDVRFKTDKTKETSR
ncbi:hypothetical protein GF373_04315 [bacterium]|nr:hypothetical protein [bacterium]